METAFAQPEGDLAANQSNQDYNAHRGQFTAGQGQMDRPSGDQVGVKA